MLKEWPNSAFITLHLSVLQTPLKSNFGLRPSIQFQVHERTLQTIGHQAEHLYSLSPKDGWPIGMNKSMARTIPLFLGKPPAKQLVPLSSNHRICSQLMVK